MSKILGSEQKENAVEERKDIFKDLKQVEKELLQSDLEAPACEESPMDFNVPDHCSEHEIAGLGAQLGMCAAKKEVMTIGKRRRGAQGDIKELL